MNLKIRHLDINNTMEITIFGTGHESKINLTYRQVESLIDALRTGSTVIIGDDIMPETLEEWKTKKISKASMR